MQFPILSCTFFCSGSQVCDDVCPKLCELRFSRSDAVEFGEELDRFNTDSIRTKDIADIEFNKHFSKKFNAHIDFSHFYSKAPRLHYQVYGVVMAWAGNALNIRHINGQIERWEDVQNEESKVKCFKPVSFFRLSNVVGASSTSTRMSEYCMCLC